MKQKQKILIGVFIFSLIFAILGIYYKHSLSRSTKKTAAGPTGTGPSSGPTVQPEGPTGTGPSSGPTIQPAGTTGTVPSSGPTVQPTSPTGIWDWPNNPIGYQKSWSMGSGNVLNMTNATDNIWDKKGAIIQTGILNGFQYTDVYLLAYPNDPKKSGVFSSDFKKLTWNDNTIWYQISN